MKQKIIFLFLCFLWNVMSVFSQPIISLENAIELTKKQNLGLQTTALEIEMTKKMQKTAFDLPKTDFSMQYGNVNNFQIDYSFNVVQSFSLPNVYQKKLAYNKQQTTLTEKKLAYQQKEIIKLVKIAYYQIVFLYEKKNLLSKQDSLQTSLTKTATTRVRIGEGKELERLSANLMLQDLKNQQNQIENELKIQKEELKKLLNLETDFDIADKKLTKRFFNFAQIDVSKNPQLIFLKQQIELQKTNTKVQKTAFSPDLRLGYYNMRESENPNLHVAQLGIALPIFNIGRKAMVSSAQIQEKIAESQLNYQQQITERNAQILKAQFERSQEAINYYENVALIEIDKIQNTFQKAYQSGEISYVELTQNRLQTFQILMNYWQELSNYNQIIIQIEFLTGE
ncbi:MAG: TolC family protein [Bacteroidetes bacterium]|nr:MAG: TolC family protein [Bacteroidota bacterium]TAG89697.1 MAG: TolC family protein [Bacteroidota bacterium]